MPLRPPNPNLRRSKRSRRPTAKGKAYFQKRYKTASTAKQIPDSKVQMSSQQSHPDVAARSERPFKKESSGHECLPMTPVKSEKSVQLTEYNGAAGASVQPLQSPLCAGLFSPTVTIYPTAGICTYIEPKSLDFSDFDLLGGETGSPSTTSESASSDDGGDPWKGLNLD